MPDEMAVNARKPGRGRLAPPPSPSDCAHRRLEFIQGGRSSHEAYREHVAVCLDCGEFRVQASKAGVSVDVRFTLVTSGAIRAAGLYLEHLRAEEPFA